MKHVKLNILIHTLHQPPCYSKSSHLPVSLTTQQRAPHKRLVHPLKESYHILYPVTGHFNSCL